MDCQLRNGLRKMEAQLWSVVVESRLAPKHPVCSRLVRPDRVIHRYIFNPTTVLQFKSISNMKMYLDLL
jgi:hypothetical protein